MARHQSTGVLTGIRIAKGNVARGSSTRTQELAERKRFAGPVHWNELPHQELWKAAIESTCPGSLARAREDAKLHVLKRRLRRFDSTEHKIYLEIECGRTVELLRAVRDRYREFLERRGAAPLAEMYWVVARFGVMDWAVMALRDAAFRYISDCQITAEQWDLLYGNPSRWLWSPDKETRPVATHIHGGATLGENLEHLLKRGVFDEVSVGGPFGRDQQKRRAGTMMAAGFLRGLDSKQTINERLQLWDDCRPWTEGLAVLFDAVQEELFFQHNALGDDGRRAESKFVQLSALQRIVHKHLRDMVSGSTSRKLEEVQWMALFRQLDEAQIPLTNALSGRAREVLMALKKKGITINTWVECYTTKATVILDDGARYSLRREVTHAMQNAADAASLQFSKIWRADPTKTSVASQRSGRAKS
ncbi:MAG: hypothetical protein QOK38_3249 [Acidobacteriaceae bacterium]|jgi:hypothetical protein|nr:hypothetical protein [Acidobacteriaceae bacterium]